MDEEEIIGIIENARKQVEEKLSELDQKMTEVEKLIKKMAELQNSLSKAIMHKRRPPI